MPTTVDLVGHERGEAEGVLTVPQDEPALVIQNDSGFARDLSAGGV